MFYMANIAQLLSNKKKFQLIFQNIMNILIFSQSICV